MGQTRRGTRQEGKVGPVGLVVRLLANACAQRSPSAWHMRQQTYRRRPRRPCPAATA